MFTGIIETLGTVAKIEKDHENLNLTIHSSLAPELKIDQSVSHNGICLTVTQTGPDWYAVTAIRETIVRTSIGGWREGGLVNLERGMKLGDRLDGHLVQGHVDQTATCTSVMENGGSWIFNFAYDRESGNITIEKGSITVNGVSLTVVDSAPGEFSVAIIPYTYENTNFAELSVGQLVNLEFDVIGKYIARLYESGNWEK